MDLIQPVRPDLTDALLQKVDEVRLLRKAALSRMESGMPGGAEETEGGTVELQSLN